MTTSAVAVWALLSVIVYGTCTVPEKSAAGVYVTLPSAFSTALPTVGCVIEVTVGSVA